MSVMGRPLASTSTWILVVSSPRERPMHRAGASSPSSACGPASRRIEEESTIWRIAVASLGDGFESLVPDAQLPPPDEAVVARRRRDVALGNVGPRRTRPQPPADAVRNAPIIHPRHAARLVREQRLDDRPFRVRQLVPAWIHAPNSFGEFESEFHRQRKPLYGAPCSQSLLSFDPVAGVLLLSGVGGGPPPDGVG